jgi:hypothetical protein
VKSDERLLQETKRTDPEFPGTTASGKTGIQSNFTSTTLLSAPGMRDCTRSEQYEIHSGRVPDDPDNFSQFC